MNLLLTQSRDLLPPMERILSRSVEIILRNNKNPNAEKIHVLIGDAPGGDAFIIRKIDEINQNEILIPITVYGAYNRMRNRTATGENITLDGNYLARDRYMAKLCFKAWACWNGMYKNNTPGRSGTVATGNYVKKNKKKVKWTYKKP